ncbi:MAG: hypothetical protein LH469_01445 [Frankiaceae bacterium]|nr:hypothetical protein [Frankiaceae bacterium]
MPAARLLLALVLATTAALSGCTGSEQDPFAAPTAFSLPAAEAEQDRTAYIAEVVAAPEGDDLAAGAGEW